MKKNFIITISLLLLSQTARSQSDDYVIPQTIDYMVTQRMSPDGVWLAGQDVYGSLMYRYNTQTQEVDELVTMYTGIGNCVSNTGVIVGQDIGGIDQHAAVVFDGKPSIPLNLLNIGMSSLDGITPDGKRAVGYMTNQDGGVMFIPMYVTMNSAGYVSKPIALPYPERDVKGSEPQGVTAVWISDDGMTVAGIVTSGTGFYDYPIIFRQDENGDWSYTIPKDIIEHPNDYSFIANMAMTSDGKKLFLGQMRSQYSGPSTVVETIAPYIYDIENDVFTEIKTDVEMLIPVQMLDDGTLLGTTYMKAFMPFTSHIKLPDSDRFIPFAQYMEEKRPAFFPWLDDTLGEYGITGYDENGQAILGWYIITGNIYVSRDMNVISGGYPVGEGFSYVFEGSGEITNPGPDPGESGFETIVNPDGKTIILDIDGRRINSDKLENLPKGIYIVNGKKVIL